MERPAFSPKLKEKNGEKWSAELSSHLYPGEVIWALARTSLMRPMIDCLAITNARVLGLSTPELTSKGPKVQVDADSIAAFDFVKKLGTKHLSITTHQGDSISFGTTMDAEIEFLRHYIHHLAQSGFPASIREALEQQSAAEHAESAVAHAASQQQIDGRAGVHVVGPALKDNAWTTLHDHSSPGELPWFVLNAGGGRGMLAAFEDRLIIAKVGGMTSFMAGSFGGGRVTTFPYSDITNIEFNSGLLQGVLEVLTPSYQGTGNHDYWRSSNKGRNKAADDPWTLSNCLPMDKSQYKTALPKINELQRKISEAKRPNVVVQQHSAPAPAASGLAEELKGLGELYQQGILDQTEFAAAKSAAIARHSAR